ncbi:MAG: FKBP-type peptidyl-prolyl cis-trans isomerase [Lysobacteraceae bacterium]
MQFHPRLAAPVAVAVLAVAFATTTAFAAAAQPQLKTEKDKVSYAIGMQMAAQLQEIKGDVDSVVIARAIATGLAGGKSLMTVPEAQATLKQFSQDLRARQSAEAQKVGQANLAEGAAFLAANAKKPGVKTTPSGLQYQVLHAGTGPKPKATDSVKVNYVGSSLDGKIFDSSATHGGPAVFTVNGVIPGWTEGLQLMGVGSKYVFWIPGNLGYGAQGSGPAIGPNATLKFEVELVSIGAK